MRKTLLVLSVASISLAAQVGCEDQQPSANQNMTEALQVLSRAGQGYVPAATANASADAGAANLQTYRQQALGEAATRLEAVAQAGSPEQQISARRLLADIDASAARYTVRGAVTEYAALAARSATLLSYLNAVERAAERTQLFSQDHAKLIEATNKLIAAQQAQQRKLQGEADQLRKKIASLQAQQGQLKSQIDAAMSEVQGFGQQAFVAEGEARYKLQEQQAAAQARANTLASQSEELQVQVDVVQADLTIAEAQLAAIQQTLKALAAQVKQSETRTRTMTQKRAEAESDRLEAVELLVEEFHQVLSVYEQAVNQPLVQAGQRVAQAAARLESALNQAGGSHRQQVQVDLLAARVEQAHVLSEHAVVAAGLGRIVQILAERAPVVMPQQAQQFAEVHAGIVKAQDAVIAEATAAIEAGRTLANELASAPGDTATRAAAQAQRLQGYLARMNQNNLP